MDGSCRATAGTESNRLDVIFSDGVEADAIEFNAGAIARVRAADRKAMLVTP